MIEFIKKYWKIIIGALLAIGGLILGLFINNQSRRIGDTIGGGVSGSKNPGIELASGLGAAEENQRSASHRLSELADSNQRATGGQQSAGGLIDDAKAKLDRIDSILGTK